MGQFSGPASAREPSRVCSGREFGFYAGGDLQRVIDGSVDAMIRDTFTWSNHSLQPTPGSGISWRSQRRHQSVAQAAPSAARIVVAARFTLTGPAWRFES